MQKIEAQHDQAQSASAAALGEGMSVESPQIGQIAQLQTMVGAHPRVNRLAHLTTVANNGPRAIAQRRAMDSIHRGPPAAQGVVMMKKDAALAELAPKEDGWTATKIIKPKNGNKGVFRFPMKGSNIDTFVGTNSVPSGVTIPPQHSDAENPGNIFVKVADHDLANSYVSGVAGLSKSEITDGTRPVHFAHGDKSHGNPSREDSLTWHHKAQVGHMELIDMNVHGAFWHYGGIAHWGASLHGTSDGDDDGGTS
jgi:hypothetical protein